MSLEAEIISLRLSIEALTVALLRDVPNTPEPEPKPTPQPALTKERLQALCMEIVKADRDKKASVYAIVADHGNGAKTIAGVPEEAYAALEQDLITLGGRNGS